MNYDLPKIPPPHCPRCYSRNLLPLSKETLIKAGIGAGIGGALAALGLFTESDNRNSNGIPSIVTGTITGAMAGIIFSYGEPDGKMSQNYLCLHCYHRFMWFRASEL